MWTYQSQDGEVLARVRREDTPPLGYPVSICGDGGPVRNYKVVAVDGQSKVLTLATAGCSSGA